MKSIKFFLVLSIPLIISASCNNQNRTVAEQKNPDKTAVIVPNAKVVANADDEKFVKEASNAGLMEAELGKYAAQNAQSPRVRSFASMIAGDQTKINAELKSIVSARNIGFPSSLDENSTKEIERLKKKTGADFDSGFMKFMVDDNQKNVDNFKTEAEKSADPELKAFAEKTLAILLVHQDSAKKIREAVR